MYGYEIPRYAKEYLQEWRRDDRFLRLRWSLDYPGVYVLERKTRHLEFPDLPLSTDRAVQYKDGYRLVVHVPPYLIHRVRQFLVDTDLQRHGGAKVVADQLDALDEWEYQQTQRRNTAEFEAISSDVYDRFAWDEGRRISMGGNRVGR